MKTITISFTVAPANEYTLDETQLLNQCITMFSDASVEVTQQSIISNAEKLHFLFFADNSVVGDEYNTNNIILPSEGILTHSIEDYVTPSIS